MENLDLKTSAVLCFAFGKRSNGLGLSNKFLLDRVKDFCKKNSLAVIIQKDCVDSFFEKSNNVNIISKHRVPGNYLDTVEVLDQAVDLCVKNNYKKVFIFAHPDHIKRIRKLLKGYNLIYKFVDTRGCPYDPKSSQIWTRNKFYFLLRELFVILYYVFKR